MVVVKQVFIARDSTFKLSLNQAQKHKRPYTTCATLSKKMQEALRILSNETKKFDVSGGTKKIDDCQFHLNKYQKLIDLVDSVRLAYCS